MTVRKLSISKVEQTIKAAAAREGMSVSAWVAEAASRQAAEEAALAEGRAAARELIAEYEAEHGPVPEASRRRAHQALAELGLLVDGELPAAG
jgi:hypothetical protein